MTMITRQQLRDAIEDGIAAAGDVGDFTPEYAAGLRAVADSVSLVARGTYAAPCPEGGRVLCPVGAAFPVWPSNEFTWLGAFTTAYDSATFRALVANDQSIENVLHITDNDSTEGQAA